MNIPILLFALSSLVVCDDQVDWMHGFRPLPWMSNLPVSFDARSWDPWSGCRDLLTEVPFQCTRCGDCYAHIVALTLSQRYCLNRKDTPEPFTKSLSSRHVATCANPKKNGCLGGDLQEISHLLRDGGVLTGSTSKLRRTGCQPYLLPSCLPDDNPPECRRLKKKEVLNAGTCSDICDGPDKSPDKIGGNWDFGMAKSLDVEEIKRAIFYGGPVAAKIIANDTAKMFKGYSSGILEVPQEFWISHPTNHAVVTIGWGRQGGKEFWIITNTWSNTWGEKGFGRIVSGKNMLKIETEVFFPRPNSEGAINGTMMVLLESDGSLPYRCYSISGGRVCPDGYVKFGYKTANLEFGCLDQDHQRYSFYSRHPHAPFQEKHYFPIKRTVHIPVQCAKIPSYWIN